MRAGFFLVFRSVHVEAAQTQYVGRTITEFLVMDPNFAVSPPYFKNTPVDINDIISQNFINLPSNLNRVAEYSLSSLVFHRDVLFSNLSNF